MALKAGRRGLNKRLVDAFGNFNGEVPSGDYYTKQQTDNKFETKTHVNNTFQKKTLEVPLEMLSGSKLTVEDALQGLNEEKFTYADNGVLGAKNLIPYPYFSKNTTVAGITWTVDSDGIITANGTSQDSSFSLVSSTKKLLLKKGSYLLTGGHTDTKVVFLYDGTSFHTDYGDGRLITFDNDVEVEIAVRIRDGQTASNEVFKPMLRLASDTDNTYVPYAMTNRELTDKVFIKNIIDSSKDLNDVTETGIYTLTSQPTNSPFSYGSLIVEHIGASAIRQIGYKINKDSAGAIYIRLYSDNTWGSWYYVPVGSVVS